MCVCVVCGCGVFVVYVVSAVCGVMCMCVCVWCGCGVFVVCVVCDVCGKWCVWCDL